MKKGLELSHGSKVNFCDTATGSPVIEIGYNQLFSVAVPEEVDVATYQ